MDKIKVLFLYVVLMTLNLNSKSTVECILSTDIINDELACDAIIRKERGFETDFLVLHCLVKKYNPTRLFEIGTCEGYGTLIMANACHDCEIISLDLFPETPPFFHKADAIGWRCNKPYRQVYGNSLTYDFSQHFPIDAWFIDGAHDYMHIIHETGEAVKSCAKLIVYHDTDISEVLQAVIDGLEDYNYTIYRVIDSRISYAIKNS